MGTSSMRREQVHMTFTSSTFRHYLGWIAEARDGARANEWKKGASEEIVREDEGRRLTRE